MTIKDYFSFTRGEKRGTAVLLIIIVILIIANFSIDLLASSKQTDFSEFEKEIDAFEKEINTRKNSEEVLISTSQFFAFNPNTISDEEWKQLGFKNWQVKTINNYKAKGGHWKTKIDVSKIYGLEVNHYELLKPFILLPDDHPKDQDKSTKEKSRNIEYFQFNPNTITKEEWEKLGFKDWQIETIFNYKSKGGKWKTKADFQKIYGLNETDYEKLEPFILLPNEPEKKNYNKKVYINTANEKELTNLKGVYSEKYASIIIKYRNSLGGFINKEQLKEVWDLNDETYNGLKDQIIIAPQQINKININTTTAEKLKLHPYINWKIANAITKYRKANGNFKRTEDIKKIHLINNETYLKIVPYLTIQ